MITHIFKDGTTKTELKEVYVPLEIVERIHGIVRKEKEDGRQTEPKDSLLG